MARRVKVLSIEDEPAIRRSIVAYLEDSGFEMLEAADGESGIATCRREHPDVVLCDLRLPGIDGLEVLSVITRESPDTPVIVVSGVDVLGYAVQALKRGAWDYVTKPIQDMEVLESAVHRVVERADLIRQNRQYREHLEELNRQLTRTVSQLQEDEEAGRRVQSQLLPEDNQVFGPYVFRRRLYPSMYLSGDFVDYYAIDGRYVGFYMADVSGHGAASAFVAVMLKILMDQYRWAYRSDGDETILQPAATLERLNRDLCQEHLDKYLTMFYGVLDQKENVLFWCNGAQFPYPILHDGREARWLSFRSRPVGLFEGSEFSSRHIDLPQEFLLLLVSDGILELLPRGLSESKSGALLAAVTESRITLEGLAAKLGVKGQRELPDDIALLAVTRGGVHG